MPAKTPLTAFSVPSGEALIGRVLARYKLPAPVSCRFWHFGVNETYQVVAGTQTFFLRLYRRGWRNRDEILAEVDMLRDGPHGITVNQVAPGWMISDKYREGWTARTKTGEPIDDSEYAQNVPMRRRGEDQDIANAICFLASDRAAFISGVYLPVCGGNVMPTI